MVKRDEIENVVLGLLGSFGVLFALMHKETAILCAFICVLGIFFAAGWTHKVAFAALLAFLVGILYDYHEIFKSGKIKSYP